jgi:hypothetical protein
MSRGAGASASGQTFRRAVLTLGQRPCMQRPSAPVWRRHMRYGRRPFIMRRRRHKTRSQKMMRQASTIVRAIVQAEWSTRFRLSERK